MKTETKFFINIAGIVLLFYIALVLCNRHYDTSIINTTNRTTKINIYFKYGINKIDFINLADTIISYEGVSLIPYYFNNNVYIGYGHLILYNEKYLLKGIDSNKTKFILYNDIKKAMIETLRLTKLKGNKLLCISDFIFNYGSNKFLKSTLYKTLKANESDTFRIKIELLKWNKINDKIHSKLSQRRYFDYSLYSKKQ
jgi:GH24 family phage-related lysozyme (muramidase)